MFYVKCLHVLKICEGENIFREGNLQGTMKHCATPPSFQDFIKKRLETVVIVVIASYPIDLQRISMTTRQKSLVIRCHIPIISDNE